MLRRPSNPNQAFGTIALLVSFALAGPRLSQAQEPAPTARTGEQIYQASCALCHGVTGDGKGLVVLDRPARSFLEGAFSFGNTPEAVLRTVKAGIGGTPMPGFGTVLSEQELRKVVAFVIAMGPKQAADSGQASVMVVGDRPLVVRGHLPPVSNGAPEHPRGLLIGTTDGLSWEYRTIDLALLAVRQGAFVDRKDWGGRGGAPLQPLGKIAYLEEGGQPESSFWTEAGSGPDAAGGKLVPLHLQLESTTVRQGQVKIAGRLLKTANPNISRASIPILAPEPSLATVQQTGAAFSLATAAGFERKFVISGEVKHISGAFQLDRPHLAFRLADVGPGSERFNAEGRTWIWIADDHHPHILGIQMENSGATLLEKGGHLMLDLPGGPGELQFSIAVLPLNDANPATWNQIREELNS
jgi:mono/diheme cytochrome c family protein